MPPRPAIAVALGRRRLSAVHAVTRAGELEVLQVLNTTIPDRVGDEPAARGAWMGEAMRDAGLPRGRATAVLPREQLGFKRITLPSVVAAELPGMVRLALQRDLPFDAAGAVIDFLPVQRTETSTTVVAYAAPAAVLEATRETYRAAGLRIERIAPRDVGAAALLGTLGLETPGAMLAIDITPENVSFCVVADAAARFSRSAQLAAEGDAPRVAAVVTETRRTWMSYRIVDENEEVGCAILLGNGIAADAAEAVAGVLQVPVRTIDAHPAVVGDAGSLHEAWPLAGILLESALGTPAIDLAAPRQAPDTSGRRRRVALIAVGALVVVFAGIYTNAWVSRRNLEQQIAALSDQARQVRPERLRYKRDTLKLEHVKQWRTAQVAWVDHLAALCALAPDRRRLVLDGWSGALDFRGVRYDDEDGWSAPGQVRIGVEGEAADRATADAFRARLVGVDPFVTTSAGADSAGGRRLPFSFSYVLRADSLDGVRPSETSP